MRWYFSQRFYVIKWWAIFRSLKFTEHPTVLIWGVRDAWLGASVISSSSQDCYSVSSLRSFGITTLVHSTGNMGLLWCTKKFASVYRLMWHIRYDHDHVGECCEKRIWCDVTWKNAHRWHSSVMIVECIPQKGRVKYGPAFLSCRNPISLSPVHVWVNIEKWSLETPENCTHLYGPYQEVRFDKVRKKSFLKI